MLSFFGEGFLLGISLGLGCLVTCGPVLLAFMLRSKRTFSNSLLIFGEILLGRFVGYAFFGAISGMLGGAIPDTIRQPITFGSFVVLGAFLIFYGIKGERKPGRCAKSAIKNFSARYASHPVLLGLLTGLELCPPFLLAVARAASTGGAFGGFTLFIGFFFATSLFMLPVAFFSVAGNLKGFRVAAAIASVAVGAWFFIQGASGLTLHFNSQRTSKDYSIVGVADAPQVWLFSENQIADSLVVCLKSRIRGELSIIGFDAVDSIASYADTLSIALWIIPENVPDTLTNCIGVIIFSDSLNIKNLQDFCDFITSYYFKRRFGKGFSFSWSGS